MDENINKTALCSWPKLLSSLNDFDSNTLKEGKPSNVSHQQKYDNDNFLGCSDGVKRGFR